MTRPEPTDVPVRIGGLEVVAGAAPARLVTVGLGSCVGLALVDQRRGTVGLAHVFLPEPPPSGVKPGAGEGTYAVLAVPALLRRLLAASGPAGSTRNVVAVLAGGATMFGGGRPGQDVGGRNVAAVRAALVAAGIEVVAEETGGSHGRTMRVTGGELPVVTVREVGGEERVAWQGSARATTVRFAPALDRRAA